MLLTSPSPTCRNHLMRPDPRFLDDIAKVAGGAVNVFSGLRQQIESEIKTRVEELASRMDLVPREDVDRLEALVRKLSARVDALEGKKKPAAKPAVKPKVKKKKK